MNVNGLPISFLIILGGIGVITTVILLLRFGKIIARALLIAGILAAIIVGLLALFTQAGANRETAQAAIQAAEAAKTASVGQSLTAVFSTLCIGGLATVFLASLGGAGYLWVRLQWTRNQLGNSHHEAPGNWLSGPNALWGRDKQPDTLPAQQQSYSPIVYQMEAEPEPIDGDFQGWNFEQWGW